MTHVRHIQGRTVQTTLPVAAPGDKWKSRVSRKGSEGNEENGGFQVKNVEEEG